MQSFNIYLNKAAAGQPVSVEVSARYEKHILEHIGKVVPMTFQQLMTLKEAYTDKGMEMVRFTLPGVTNEQLSQISWFIGEWYSWLEPLVKMGLRIGSGCEHYHDPAVRHNFVRIGFASMNVKELEEAVSGYLG